MALIDLRKHLNAKKTVGAASAAPKTPDLPAAPVMSAPPPSWGPELMLALTAPVQRTHDILLLGLGPWGKNAEMRSMPEALLGLARSVVVVDADRSRLNVARSYVARTVEADLSDRELGQQIGNQLFDAVLIPDALVMLAEPLMFLRELGPLLSPDGQIVALVPNMAHADRRLSLLAGDAPREFEPGGARHQYNRQRLRELFAFAGFSVKEFIPVAQAPLGQDSGLVPELFPQAVLDALEPAEDASAAFFVVRAVPATAQSLMRNLFDEQALLRKVLRNELAIANRTGEGMKQDLSQARTDLDRLNQEVETSRTRLTELEEQLRRSEDAARRVRLELELNRQELSVIKSGFWYKLGQLFSRDRKVVVSEFTPTEPMTWPFDRDGNPLPGN